MKNMSLETNLDLDLDLNINSPLLITSTSNQCGYESITSVEATYNSNSNNNNDLVAAATDAATMIYKNDEEEQYSSSFSSCSLKGKRCGQDQHQHQDQHHRHRLVPGISHMSTRSIRDILNKSLHQNVNTNNKNNTGSATILNEIFNLIKNIVGCGVLSLPSGIAAFANDSSAILPAIIVIMITALIFGYFFLLLGRVCQLTNASSFRDAWERTLNKGAYVVTLSNLLKPAMGNLALSIILTDTLQSLLLTAGLSLSRNMTLLLCTTFGIFPLCLIQNLTVLAPFSMVGIMAMIVTAVSMGIRYLDGSYDLEDGRYVQDLPEHLKPSFGSKGANYALSPNILIFTCMLFEAFIAHYNAPRFYVELKDTTVRRFAVVSSWSFFFSSVFFALIASFGFLTFGENSDGFILNNYATTDRIATICRISIFIGVLLTYPVIFMGFRDGILDLCSVPMESRTFGNLNVITFVLVGIITVFGLFISDLGIVNTVGGGTLATMIVFVFPTLMFASVVYNPDQDVQATWLQKVEVWFAFLLMILGISMGIIGVSHAFID